MAITNSEWGTRIDEVEDRIYRINTKTPARSLASSGGHCLRSLVFAHSALRPRDILDFQLGCRCQVVGNCFSPGGVMSAAHPPSKLATA